MKTNPLDYQNKNILSKFPAFCLRPKSAHPFGDEDVDLCNWTPCNKNSFCQKLLRNT